MMSKHIISLIAFTVVSLAAFTQINTTLTVSRPSATISDWANSNTTIIYLVENQGSAGGLKQVIIHAVLSTTDGTIVATKDLTKAQVFTLQPGTTIFYAKDVFPLDIMMFTGSYKNTLQKTGMLPSGTYQLSVQLVTPGVFAPLTPMQSRVFNLAAPQLPYLVTPLNNDTLNAKRSETSIIFRWTPLIPILQEQPYYRLQVFEVLPYQQPLQALRGNQPILDKLLKSQTQFIWRPQMSFSTDSIAKKFIWTIQTLNADQQPFIRTSGNGESRSEPFQFMIKSK
jgi:hypothetical protein